MHAELTTWIEDNSESAAKLTYSLPMCSDTIVRRKVVTMAYGCLAFVKRFLATLYESERIRLEVEVQALANHMLVIRGAPSREFAWLFTPQEDGISVIITLTASQWLENVEDLTVEEKRQHSHERFNVWSNMMRMSW